MIDPKKLTPEGRDRLRLLGRVVAVPTKRARTKDAIALFRKITRMGNEGTINEATGKVRVLSGARPAPKKSARRGRK